MAICAVCTSTVTSGDVALRRGKPKEERTFCRSCVRAAVSEAEGFLPCTFCGQSERRMLFTATGDGYATTAVICDDCVSGFSEGGSEAGPSSESGPDPHGV